MWKPVVGKPEMLAEMNKKLILDYLRKCGPQSRAELSRNLGLSFPSISANVESLLESNLITVVEGNVSEEVGAGRKPILFRYNSEWGYVVSIDLGRSCVRMMACNVGGGELAKISFHLDQFREDQILEEIDRHFLQLLEQTGVPLEKVFCVSIAMPGILDERTGRLEAAPFLSERLRSNRVDTFLSQKYGLRTFIGNAVNFAAIAEKWQGVGVEYSDIVYVDCAVGIGSALILDGKLITGFNGAAGEIGYMIPGIAFCRKTYDEEGVLEKLLAGCEVERRLAMLSQGSNGQDPFAGSEQMQRKLYLEDIRNYLAMTLVNLVAVINPEIVIVGGGLGRFLMKTEKAFFEEFLRAHVPYVPKLENSTLDENAALLGAAAYALRLVHDEQTGSHQTGNISSGER